MTNAVTKAMPSLIAMRSTRPLFHSSSIQSICLLRKPRIRTHDQCFMIGVYEAPHEPLAQDECVRPC